MKRSNGAQVQNHNASVLARVALLKSVIDSPSKLDTSLRHTLLAALSNQHGLANLETSSPNLVTPMSLNTMKTRSLEVIDGGFQYLDELRKKARLRLLDEEEKERRPTRGSKQELMRQLAAQKLLVTQLHNEIAQMTAKLLEYTELARDFAIQAGEVPNFSRKHRELLRKYSHTWLDKKK